MVRFRKAMISGFIVFHAAVCFYMDLVKNGVSVK